MLRRSYLLAVIIFVSFSFTFAGKDTVLFGRQSRRNQLSSAKLESEPVEIAISARISKVRGGKAGFWISRKQGLRTEVIQQFRSPEEAIGTILEPGLYVVYPMIPTDEQEETVTVYLESGRKAGVRKSPASGQALKVLRSTVQDYYDKISSASGSQRKELCRKAIEGFSAVVDSFSEPKAIATRKVAAYYQAQCYRELQDSEGYRLSLEKCLGLLPEPEDDNDDTLSLVMSVHIAAQKELDALK